MKLNKGQCAFIRSKLSTSGQKLYSYVNSYKYDYTIILLYSVATSYIQAIQIVEVFNCAKIRLLP